MSAAGGSILVIGSGGQDGSYLVERGAEAGAFVVGVTRQGVRRFGAARDVALPAVVDLSDATGVAGLIEAVAPDEIYYLAAHHHSAEDKGAVAGAMLFRQSYETHVMGLVNVLEAVRAGAPRARLFYAASSHVFGDPPAPVQDERTPLAPRGAYAITKVCGMHCCRHYRHAHGVHASVGILYNHESPRRRADFLSRRITRAVAEVRHGRREHVTVGDLSARVDWGYAPDYVDAMVRIVGQPVADDYVIATGEAHTVRDFVAAAFGAAGLDWQRHVREDPSLLAKARPAASLVGDASKLRRATGWRPSVTFEEMVAALVRAEDGSA